MAYSLVQTIPSPPTDASVNATNQAYVETGASASPITAGNTLIAFVNWGGSGTVSLADQSGSNDTWTQCGSTIDFASGGYHLAMYRLENAAAGTLNLRATAGGSNYDYPAIVVYEFSGLSTSGFDKTTGRVVTPGTATDAIASGYTGALASQPQLILGFCYESNASGTLAGGTGFTAEAGIWKFGATYGAILEHKRVTTTSTDQATFTDATNGGTSEFPVIVATFAEGGGGATYTLMGQACL